MKKTIRCIIILIVVAVSHTFAQKARQVTVKNIKFNLNTSERVIEINYDVEKIIPEDSVYIIVINRDKKNFKATSLRGDIGKNVTPGSDKKIIWDIMADSLQINEDIAITVSIKLYNYYQKPDKSTAVTVNTEPFKEIKKNDLPDVKTPKIRKQQSKLNIITLGIFGAGVAAGGYMVFNGLQQKSIAQDYYQSYIDNNWNQKLIVSDDPWLKQYSEGSISSANAMLARSQEKLKKSNIMLYSGIGLIVADAILTIPRFRRKTNKKVSFKTDYLPSSQTFVLGANFKF